MFIREVKARPKRAGSRPRFRGSCRRRESAAGCLVLRRNLRGARFSRASDHRDLRPRSAGARLLHQFSNPAVGDALLVTLKTSVAAQAAILLFGTPTAYFLATRRFPGRAVLVTLTELPFVLPPAVAGIGLIVAFGKLGLLGSTFSWLGIDVAFNMTAVVFAVMLVASRSTSAWRSRRSRRSTPTSSPPHARSAQAR